MSKSATRLSQKGSLLLLTLVALSVVSFLTALVLTATNVAIQANNTQLQKTAAFNTATPAPIWIKC